jgi:lipopolysaccharide export system protein LptA
VNDAVIWHKIRHLAVHYQPIDIKMRRAVVFFSIHLLIFASVATLCSYGYGQDNVPLPSGKKPAKDSVVIPADSNKAAVIARLKAESDLEVPIDYKAVDLMVFDVEGKTLYLQNSGELTYDKMTLKADSVMVNWETTTLSARGKVDSTGQIRGRPELVENDQNYNAEGLTYNFKTQKGLITGARTKQGEDYILADSVRKQDESTYYIKDGKFTTCDADHPHFYIKSSKLKIIPKDKIITGPLMLVIEDFPLPLILPFGFFPNQTGKRSGVVMPTYGEATDRGFFLRNGGYYFALNDNFDLMVRGDIFSKGGWRLEASTDYNKRYSFSGGFQAEYGVQKYGESTDPNYREERNFWVKWRHNQTINPQADLKADVSVGSSNFFKNNSYNEQEYLTNTLKSTVNFNQRFANSPFRLNVQLSQSQNTQTSIVNLGLPTVTVTRSRWLPFKGKNATGDKWYHKVGLTYSANVKNQITVPDSLVADVLFNPTGYVTLTTEQDDTTVTTSQRALDYFSNGLVQTIPISTQLNVLQYVTLTPTFNYSEYWYIKSVEKTFNPTRNLVETENIYGFTTARDFRFNFNTATRLYGVYQFKKSKRSRAIRHTLQPSIGYTYRPDFGKENWGYFQTVQSDTLGNELTYSRFEGSVVGGPSAGEQQTLSFVLNNILEMKYKKLGEDVDTTKKDQYTRMNILDNLGMNVSYNFAADSLNLSPVSLSARTNILNNKFSIQLNGAIDPYSVSPTGRRTNTFRLERNGKIGRLSTFSMAFNTGLTSKKGKVKAQAPLVGAGPQVNPNPGVIPDDEWNSMQYYRDLYVDFNIPWRLNLSYLLSYSNNGIRKDTNMTVNFNGDLNLTPKWKIGFTSGYDFNQSDFSYTSFTIFRDLHCWEMSMTWVPFGERQSFNLAINVKSATLKDLKLTKRRDWQDRF